MPIVSVYDCAHWVRNTHKRGGKQMSCCVNRANEILHVHDFLSLFTRQKSCYLGREMWKGRRNYVNIAQKQTVMRNRKQTHWNVTFLWKMTSKFIMTDPFLRLILPNATLSGAFTWRSHKLSWKKQTLSEWSRCFGFRWSSTDKQALLCHFPASSPGDAADVRALSVRPCVRNTDNLARMDRD